MSKVRRLRKSAIRLTSNLKRALGLSPEIPEIPFGTSLETPTPQEANPTIAPYVRAIAYYLPQFHPFAENDAWWGKGFTEWSNVGKALPNFEGHYQPHCPIHLGYYDLRLVDNMIEQAKLAKSYGIHGFCYYFYWFDGKVLMHRPMEQMLAAPRVDMPFCLIWANENWSRRWDGREDDVLIAQNHSTEDSMAFIRYLEKFFHDERYIKVDGKPLLAVYRANLIPDIEATGKLWREEAVRMGFPGLYLVSAQSFDIESPAPFGFDAAVQFPPHPIRYPTHNAEMRVTNAAYQGKIFDYAEAAQRFVTLPAPSYKLMRACMLSWDNTARKQDGSLTFKDFSLTTYQQWLSHDMNATAHDARLTKDERLTFINAWNEWAEGTHLEPDRRYGYAYLQATYDVLKDYDATLFETTSAATADGWGSAPVRRHENALIVHLHYQEVFEQLAQQIEAAFPEGRVDIYVSVTSGELARITRQRFPNAYIRLVENRGRDVLPFLHMYRLVHSLGYQSICKLHSKRSLYREDGQQLLDGLLRPLIGSEQAAQSAISRFRENPTLGMLVPRQFLLKVTRRNTVSNLGHLDWLESTTGVPYEYSDFAAGTMFWFRPEALTPFLILKPEHFGLERGLADGTLPHAIERMMTSWTRAKGYTVETT